MWVRILCRISAPIEVGFPPVFAQLRRMPTEVWLEAPLSVSLSFVVLLGSFRSVDCFCRISDCSPDVLEVLPPCSVCSSFYSLRFAALEFFGILSDGYHLLRSKSLGRFRSGDLWDHIYLQPWNPSQSRSVSANTA